MTVIDAILTLGGLAELIIGVLVWLERRNGKKALVKEKESLKEEVKKKDAEIDRLIKLIEGFER